VLLERGEDFDCLENNPRRRRPRARPAHATTVYTDVFVPLKRTPPGDNAAVALTAVEAFFAGPLTEEIVVEGFAETVMPGRFEVLNHLPLVIVDGAHNPAGADMCAQVFSRLPPRGPANTRRRMLARARSGAAAQCAARRRVRRGLLLHGPSPRGCRWASSPQQREASVATT